MPEITFKCSKCGELMKSAASDAGQEGECPTCGQSIIVPGKLPPPMPPKKPEVSGQPPRPVARSSGVDGVVAAGWICWGVGIALLIVLIIIPVYVPLFIASFILGIIAITRRRTGQGIALILVSILVPPILAIIVAATVAGAAIKSLGVSPKPPQMPVATPPASIAPPPAVQELQDISLEQFLVGLDAQAKGVRSADTTARKDALRNAARDWCKTTLAGKRCTFSSQITDVRVPRDGAVEICFALPSLGSYSDEKSHALYLTFNGKVTLAMSSADAVKIGKNNRIAVSGETEFISGSGDILKDSLWGKDGLLTVTILGDMSRLGSIQLKGAKFRILGPQLGQ